MKTVTIKISDADCAYVVTHLKEQCAGRAIVAVTELVKVHDTSHAPATRVAAITSGGYFGVGEDAEEALANAYKEGARGTQTVVFYAYSGTPEEMAEVKVDDGGSIHYPAAATSIRVGKIKVAMKQKGDA